MQTQKCGECRLDEVCECDHNVQTNFDSIRAKVSDFLFSVRLAAENQLVSDMEALEYLQRNAMNKMKAAQEYIGRKLGKNEKVTGYLIRSQDEGERDGRMPHFVFVADDKIPFMTLAWRKMKERLGIS